MPKTVMIVHPMTGDIEGNLKKVDAICRAIHGSEIIPVFPSYTTRRYLTPDPKDRELAKTHIEEYLKRGFVDEVWVYGNRVTEGMMRVILTAMEYNIPVVSKSRETQEYMSLSLSNSRTVLPQKGEQ